MEYEFRISASNHVGFGQEAVKLYTTPEGAPTGPPVNISVKFQAADYVAVTWLPPLPDQRNGQILRYHVMFQRKIGDRDSPERNVTVTKVTFGPVHLKRHFYNHFES